MGQHARRDASPRGAIPAQIRTALAGLPPARQIKLYNAGSFFDPAAIPPDDDEEIAAAVGGFERVIVESHPAFLAGAYGDALPAVSAIADLPAASKWPSASRRRTPTCSRG